MITLLETKGKIYKLFKIFDSLAVIRPSSRNLAAKKTSNFKVIQYIPIFDQIYLKFINFQR